jgi:hypothetical protein
MPTAAGAPWLQFGYDAARTGVTPDPGPQTHDVAFERQLAGIPRGAPIVIVDRQAYTITSDLDRRKSTIHKIGLDTADVTPLLSLDIDFRGRGYCTPPAYCQEAWFIRPTFSSDGELLYIAHEHSMRAHRLDGEKVWEQPYPELPLRDATHFYCADPAVNGAIVYVSCVAFGYFPTHMVPVEDQHDGTTSMSFVAALDASDGHLIWWSAHEPSQQRYWRTSVCRSAPDPCLHPGGWYPIMVSVVGERVVSTLVDLAVGSIPNPAGHPVHSASVQVFDRRNGAFVWGRSSNPSEQLDTGARLSMTPTGNSTHLFMRTESGFCAFGMADGGEIWCDSSLGKEDPGGVYSGTSLALDGDTLYVATFRSIYRYDSVFRKADPHPPREFLGALDPAVDARIASVPMAMTHDRAFLRAYGRNASGPLHDYLYELDLATNNLSMVGPAVAKTNFHYSVMFAVGEGVLVQLQQDARFVVYGKTEASLAMEPAVSSFFPAPGALVEVDLTRSQPGVDGQRHGSLPTGATARSATGKNPQHSPTCTTNPARGPLGSKPPTRPTRRQARSSSSKSGDPSPKGSTSCNRCSPRETWILHGA